MRFFYGEKNILRALEEAEFWKNQESEHTVVIQEVTPELEDEYVNKLDEYKEVFDATHGRIVRLMETAVNCHNMLSPDISQDMISLIDLSVRQSQIFIDFLGLLLRESEAVKNNPAAPIVINHIRRESEYFIGIVTAFLTASCNQNNDYMRDMRDMRY